MNKTQIISSIEQGQFSTQDLAEILYAVRRVRRSIAKRCIDTFKLGDRVSFYSKGRACIGSVTKLNKSSLIVMCNSEAKKVTLISAKRA